MLRTGRTTQAEIQALIATDLASLSLREGRITSEGPNIRLPEKKALALSLALNELVTNAIKYGVLSTETESVTISRESRRRSPGFRVSAILAERGGLAIVAA